MDVAENNDKNIKMSNNKLTRLDAFHCHRQRDNWHEVPSHTQTWSLSFSFLTCEKMLQLKQKIARIRKKNKLENSCLINQLSINISLESMYFALYSYLTCTSI